MDNLYKFVPRANKARPSSTTVKQAPIRKATIERGDAPKDEKPYKITFKNGYNPTSEQPYNVEFEVLITDRAFKTRINNILDSNNYEVNYRFAKSIQDTFVKAYAELTYDHHLNERVMLSVCTGDFYEQSGKVSLVELSPQTVHFKYEQSRQAFISTFEQTILTFIDAKYEDYEKLRARLLRRD